MFSFFFRFFLCFCFFSFFRFVFFSLFFLCFSFFLLFVFVFFFVFFFFFFSLFFLSLFLFVFFLFCLFCLFVFSFCFLSLQMVKGGVTRDAFTQKVPFSGVPPFLVELSISHRFGLNRSTRHNQFALQPLCPDIDDKEPMVRMHHGTMSLRNLGFLEATELCIDPQFATTYTTDCRGKDVEVPTLRQVQRTSRFLKSSKKNTFVLQLLR